MEEVARIGGVGEDDELAVVLVNDLNEGREWTESCLRHMYNAPFPPLYGGEGCGG